MNTLNYTIPSVSCAHCKMTIEREIGDFPGVTSVNVDIDTQQAVIEFDLPATKDGIESMLSEIGYPAENQLLVSKPDIPA